MLRFRLAPHGFALTVLILGSTLASTCSAAPAAGSVGLAIEDFTYRDTSGEPADQKAVHQTRLQTFMAALRRDVEADGRYHLIPSSCAPPCGKPADLVHAASAAGAKVLIVGGIQKLSTLVQWAKVTAIEIGSDRILLDKLFTFRGDNAEAWDRAEAFVYGEIRAALAAATPAPAKLAVFDFELEDASAGASSTGETAADDAAQLAEATSQVRRLLTQSGRYQLIDVGGADDNVARAHALRDCDGCDAGIALKTGAEQSLIGVVRRISRTEYTVRFRIRDARTGAIVSEGSSGLRMGANYSWSRGRGASDKRSPARGKRASIRLLCR
jgi:hypothetical protein